MRLVLYYKLLYTGRQNSDGKTFFFFFFFAVGGQSLRGERRRY